MKILLMRTAIMMVAVAALSTVALPAQASGLGELAKIFGWLVEHRPRLNDIGEILLWGRATQGKLRTIQRLLEPNCESLKQLVAGNEIGIGGTSDIPVYEEPQFDSKQVSTVRPIHQAGLGTVDADDADVLHVLTVLGPTDRHCWLKIRMAEKANLMPAYIVPPATVYVLNATRVHALRPNGDGDLRSNSLSPSNAP